MHSVLRSALPQRSGPLYHFRPFIPRPSPAPPKRPRSHSLFHHHPTIAISPRTLCTQSSSSPYVSQHFRLAPNQLEDLLHRHDLQHRYTPTHALVKICPFCHPTHGKSDNEYKLYILRTSGAFMCHRCRISGSWYDFRRMLNPDLISSHVTPVSSIIPTPRPDSHTRHFRAEDHTLTPKPVPTSTSAQPVSVDAASQERFVNALLTKDTFSPVRKYLRDKRGLSDNVLRAYGVGAAKFDVQDESGNWTRQSVVTLPMHDVHGTVVRYKIRPIEQKVGMRLEPRGGSWGLFGLATVAANTKRIVLTEGEFDAMAVFQMTGTPAVSVPNGASSLPVEVLPMLERFDEIVLWMDADEPGQTGAKQFCRKLGLQRCRMIDTRVLRENGCKDANDALRKGIDVKGIIEKATNVPHEGIIRFEDFREEVYDHMKNAQSYTGMKSESLPGLNRLIKGHRPGELTIMSGHTGIGKTTFLSQLSLDYCMQGIVTLWGSFEIGTVKLASDMLRQFHGALKGEGDVLDRYEYWFDRFSELPLLFMKYHGSNAVDVIIDTMDYANYVHDCSHVVLDNLQFMTYGQRGAMQRLDRMDVMDDAVYKIRNFCTRSNVHVSLVMHPRKEDDLERIQLASIFGSAKATQEADNVMILQRTADGSQLEVKKNRFDGSLGTVNLRFDKTYRLFKQMDSSETKMKMNVLKSRKRNKVDIVLEGADDGGGERVKFEEAKRVEKDESDGERGSAETENRSVQGLCEGENVKGGSSADSEGGSASAKGEAKGEVEGKGAEKVRKGEENCEEEEQEFSFHVR